MKETWCSKGVKSDCCNRVHFKDLIESPESSNKSTDLSNPFFALPPISTAPFPVGEQTIVEPEIVNGNFGREVFRGLCENY